MYRIFVPVRRLWYTRHKMFCWRAYEQGRADNTPRDPLRQWSPRTIRRASFWPFHGQQQQRRRRINNIIYPLYLYVYIKAYKYITILYTDRGDKDGGNVPYKGFGYYYTIARYSLYIVLKLQFRRILLE